MKSGDIVTAGAGRPDGGPRSFVLGDALGRGLWGTSWLARDVGGREFVVKVPLEADDLPEDAAVPDGLLAACRQAAHETAELYGKGLPWLPRLEAVGTTSAGAPAIVTPRYAMTFRRRIAASVPMSEGLGLLEKVISLLETAGRAHGDLRPTNVLINDRGDVVLADPLPHAIAAHYSRLVDLAGHERDEYGPPEGSSASADTFALCAMLYRITMIASGGAARDPRREERVTIPRNGLDKVELAGLKDRALTRLKDDAANPRFAPRLGERLASLLNRGLSKEADPSPPYRFAVLAELKPRLAEVAELVDPKVDDVGHILLAAGAKNGVFQGGEEVTFSVTISCSPGVQGQEDVICGLQITDLDAPEGGRVRVPDTRYTVKPHPSGRLRFDFAVPGIPPGRYKIGVAFSIKDGRAEPRPAQGEFEVRPPPGYVPPGEDPPSGPSPIRFPGAAPLAATSPEPPSSPGQVVRLFGTDPGSESSDSGFPRPIAPSSVEDAPSGPANAPFPARSNEDRDTRPAPRLAAADAIPVEIELDLSSSGVANVPPPPPLPVIPTIRPPGTSPTIAPPEPPPLDEPSNMDFPGESAGAAPPPSWSRPVDLDDGVPPANDPFAPGPAAGEDLPSFGGSKPAGAPSPLGAWVEKAVEIVRKDTYTAFMVFLVAALAFILFVFALVTLLH